MASLRFVSLSLCVALSAACSDGAASDFADPSFDNWCEQALCDWQIDQGRIAPVGTWHKKDLAVSFLDTPSQISQRVELSTVDCFVLDTIADVETKARLAIRVDFNDDGVIDFEQQVAAVSWESVPFSVRAPVDYESVRFIIRKQGEGRAVLAQLRMVPMKDCSGDPLTLADHSTCSQNEVCTSGNCSEGTCQPCSGQNCGSLAAAERSE